MLKKIKGVIALSRWIEVYDFTLALTLISVIFAQGWAGTRLIAIVVANFLAMTYAFMINDTEDAEEDAQDPKKRLRNPISNGSLTRSEGWWVSNITFLISLAIYAYVAFTTGLVNVFWAGLIALIISFLYSWRKVRLKAMPVIDVLTHMYMLSGSIFLTSYLAFSNNLSLAGWAAFIAVMIVSGYGQLDNEIRDFETDVKTKIKTTATIMGKKPAIILQTVLIIIAGIGFIYIATLLNDISGFLLRYIVSFIPILILNALTYFKTKKAHYKIWLHRSLVLAAAAAALLVLFDGIQLIK
jgi:4-hydroxybenzoate polyprenyltransferase